MRCVTLDQWYPEAFAAANTSDYAALHRFSHGTSDYLDIAIRAAGHESETLIDNNEQDIIGKAIAMQPDVIAVQNINRFKAPAIRARGFKGKLVAFCSYAAEWENHQGFDVTFSSFRWLVEELNREGGIAVYLPLAFGRPVLSRFDYPPERDLPLVFVGGLGTRIWRKGTEDLATVASAFPHDFQWWGYKVGTLPDSLERTYQGTGWGPEYWNILMRAQKVLNRHGEIAKGEGNNLRQYESIGCRAMLITDAIGELQGNPAVRVYTNTNELLSLCCMRYDEKAAREGQSDVLARHCYEARVGDFLKAVGA